MAHFAWSVSATSSEYQIGWATTSQAGGDRGTDLYANVRTLTAVTSYDLTLSAGESFYCAIRAVSSSTGTTLTSSYTPEVQVQEIKKSRRPIRNGSQLLRYLTILVK